VQGVFPILSAPTTIPLWDQRDLAYHQAAAWLDQNAGPEDAVMVVDPPSFYNISHRRAFVIPTDSLTAVSAAADKYNIRYLILEFDHPRPLNDLYLQRAAVSTLSHVADFRDALDRPVTLYEVMP
jgi:hypothetical protein